nr:MAG TPA: hypothetical protein [Caudoviricetes sp.]
MACFITLLDLLSVLSYRYNYMSIVFTLFNTFLLKHCIPSLFLSSGLL